LEDTEQISSASSPSNAAADFGARTTLLAVRSLPKNQAPNRMGDFDINK
jgi:hypothetical protein